MRQFLLCLAIVFTFKGFSYDEYLFSPKGNFIFTSHNYGPYYLSGFRFESGAIYGVENSKQEVLIGTVEKLNEWTRTYVFKVGDTILSTHRASFFSPGALFDRLKNYEIYDENNQVIGSIEGIWDTTVSAVFFFYKENREFFAKAVLDHSCSTLTISTPDDETLITGEKTLSASYFFSTGGSNKYYWKIKKEKEQTFSGLFLWPFIAFLSEVWWR